MLCIYIYYVGYMVYIKTQNLMLYHIYVYWNNLNNNN